MSTLKPLQREVAGPVGHGASVAHLVAEGRGVTRPAIARARGNAR